jgi:hypothetical protein
MERTEREATAYGGNGQGLVLSHPDLGELLESARNHVRRHGAAHMTARGATYSLNQVLLVWEKPQDSEWRSVESMCAQHVAREYYRLFVAPDDGNRPEGSKTDGEMLFPYTYAARSRFWDGGWGYVVQVLEALAAEGATEGATEGVGTIPLASEQEFARFLERVGERVHVQTLLAVLGWLGGDGAIFGGRLDLAREILRHTRVDQLQRITAEIGADCSSRRAITASFVYPAADYQLQPLMGIPAYQNFQLLPGNSPDEPLCSLHYHRSLDLMDGILLDFYHDLQWMIDAAKTAGRPLGSIAVLSGNLHVYAPRMDGANRQANTDDMLAWLLRVTDGYRAGSGAGAELLATNIYRNNVERLYRRLRGEL